MFSDVSFQEAENKTMLKPLYERRRRAVINGHLDKLRVILSEIYENENWAPQKFEKADILDLTLFHLRRMQGNTNKTSQSPDYYEAGYTTCAREVFRILAITPGNHISVAKKMMYRLEQRKQIISTRTSKKYIHAKTSPRYHYNGTNKTFTETPAEGIEYPTPILYRRNNTYSDKLSTFPESEEPIQCVCCNESSNGDVLSSLSSYNNRHRTFPELDQSTECVCCNESSNDDVPSSLHSSFWRPWCP